MATSPSETTVDPDPEGPVCTFCGDDLAAEDSELCTQCLEDGR